MSLKKQQRFTFMACSLILGLSSLELFAGSKNNEPPVRFEIEESRPSFVLDSRYLSFSIDVAYLLGIKFWDPSENKPKKPDLSNGLLRELTQALSPAYLRIGGTDADRIFYQIDEKLEPQVASKYAGVMTAKEWDSIQDFLSATHTELIFTVNAGPGPRDSGGNWQPSQFQKLLEYTRDHGYRVGLWEFGNEVNAYWLAHGLKNQLSAEHYARDYGLAKQTLDQVLPVQKLAGPASAFWPVLGEPIWPLTPILKKFLMKSSKPVDVITWHFYPTESRRCSFAMRPASLENFTEIKTFDEIRKWGLKIRKWRDQYQPLAQVWLGETGPAQCGGEPGLSDRFISALWWLDELGSAAALGNSVVVRQSLIGSDYGLLRASDLNPNSDYWSSLLWKKIMGERVLAVKSFTTDPSSRIYAHCTSLSSEFYQKGAVSLLLINLSKDHSQDISLDRFSASSWLEWRLSALHLLSDQMELNGKTLGLIGQSLPSLNPRVRQDVTSKTRHSSVLTLKPLSAAFLVFPGADFPACRD